MNIINNEKQIYKNKESIKFISAKQWPKIYWKLTHATPLGKHITYEVSGHELLFSKTVYTCMLQIDGP